MFLHLSVILFTGGVSTQGWYLPEGCGQTPPGHTPPWAYTPWGDTPLPSECRDTHPPPSACRDIHPHPVHAGIYTPAAQCMPGYGQQAGGTHPTGMHSSLFVFFYIKFDKFKRKFWRKAHGTSTTISHSEPTHIVN